MACIIASFSCTWWAGFGVTFGRKKKSEGRADEFGRLVSGVGKIILSLLLVGGIEAIHGIVLLAPELDVVAHSIDPLQLGLGLGLGSRMASISSRSSS